MRQKDRRKHKKDRQRESITKFIIPFHNRKSIIYIHWLPSGQKINKKYIPKVWREFRKRFHCKRQDFIAERSGTRVGGTNAWTINQSRVSPWYSKYMGIKIVTPSPNSPDLITPSLLVVLRGGREPQGAAVLKILR